MLMIPDVVRKSAKIFVEVNARIFMYALCQYLKLLTDITEEIVGRVEEGGGGKNT
jgi:hypothetical protein